MMRTKEAEEKHHGSKQKQAANLAAAFGMSRFRMSRFKVPGLLWSGRRHRCLFGIFIDEVMDAQFKIRAVELLGQRRELAYARNGTPRSAVDGLVMG